MTTEIRSGVSGGGGKGLASTSYDGRSGLLNMFYVIIVVIIVLLHTLVKTDQIIHLRSVNFIICKLLYSTKAEQMEKKKGKGPKSWPDTNFLEFCFPTNLPSSSLLFPSDSECKVPLLM